MTLLAVNLHYVSDNVPSSPRAIFPIGLEELRVFASQLAAAFTPVSRDEVVAAVEGRAELPSRACLVTFDDGLRQQYELALPILDALGIPAVLFVPGSPLATGKALHVHKLHALRETFDHEEFAGLVYEALEDELEPVPPADPAAAQAMYRYDGPEAAEIKYLLNVGLPRDVRERLIDRIFDSAIGDEPGFCRRLYVDEVQVADLERRGSLGSHAWSHVPVRQLSDGQLAHEFEATAELLEAFAGTRPKIVSYPYGGTDAVDRRVAAAAAAAGHVVGLTMERSLNATLEDPLLLARIDWLDAPGGRQPLLDVSTAGDFKVVAGMSQRRTRYFTERAAVSR